MVLVKFRYIIGTEEPVSITSTPSAASRERNPRRKPMIHQKQEKWLITLCSIPSLTVGEPRRWLQVSPGELMGGKMNASRAALLVSATMSQDFLKPRPLQEIRCLFSCHHSSGRTAHLSRHSCLHRKSLQVAHVLLCLSFPFLSRHTHTISP